MDDFLDAVGPELALFLRAIADWVDPGQPDDAETADPEGPVVVRKPTPIGVIDARGGWVPIPKADN